MTQNQCRICLETIYCTFKLSDKVKDRFIWEALNSLASVSIGLDDFFPQWICWPCFDKLDQAIEFQIEVERSDNVLHSNDIECVTLIKVEDEDCNGGIHEEVLTESGKQLFEPNTFIEKDISNSFANTEIKPKLEEEQLLLGNDVSSLRCCMCQRNFTTKMDLKTHAMSFHSEIIGQNLQKVYTKRHKRQCVYCKEKFRLRKSLEMHKLIPNFKEPPRDRTSEKKTKSLSSTKVTQNLRCCMCQKDFGTKTRLKSHVNTVHSDKIKKNMLKEYTMKHKHQCDYCKEKFRLMASLEYHVAIPNYKEPPRDRSGEYEKSKHKKLSPTSESINNSNEDVKNSSVMIDIKPECELEEQELDLKDDSQNLVYETDNLRCCMCKTDFETNNDLKTHTTSSHVDIINQNMRKTYTSKHKRQCVYCKKKFRLQRSLEIHFVDPNFKEAPRDRTNERKNKSLPLKQSTANLRCCMCQTDFSTKTDLKSHISSLHSEIVEQNIRKTYTTKHRFHCEYCEQKFRLQRSLNVHFFEQNFNEPRRDRKNENRKSLPKEKRINESVICSFCGKLLANKERLKIHELRIHAEEFPVVCPHPGCGKRFAAKVILKTHLLTHGERKQICDECGRAFRNQKQLISHSYIHKEVKRYQCDLCPRTFTFKNILQIHVESHFREKVYQCNQCEKSYKWDNDLKRHIQWVHEGKAPYKCKNCMKEYFCSSSKKYHEQRCNLGFK